MYQIHLKMILSQVLVICSYCPNYSGSRRLLELRVPDQLRQHIEILSQKTKKDLRIFQTMWNIACNIFCSAFKCVCVCVQARTYFTKIRTLWKLLRPQLWLEVF